MQDFSFLDPDLNKYAAKSNGVKYQPFLISQWFTSFSIKISKKNKFENYTLLEKIQQRNDLDPDPHLKWNGSKALPRTVLHNCYLNKSFHSSLTWPVFSSRGWDLIFPRYSLFLGKMSGMGRLGTFPLYSDEYGFF